MLWVVLFNDSPFAVVADDEDTEEVEDDDVDDEEYVPFLLEIVFDLLNCPKLPGTTINSSKESFCFNLKILDLINLILAKKSHKFLNLIKQ